MTGIIVYASMASLFVFPAMMAFAASTDLLTMTISNRVSIALAAAFPALAFIVGMSGTDVALHLSCGLAILVLAFLLFSFRWIGGGDAKLAAATAVWLGWAHVLDYGVLASILGGVLTLGILQMRRTKVPRWILDQSWFARLYAAGNGVPYGIALAAAGLVIYPQTPVWQALLAACARMS